MKKTTILSLFAVMFFSLALSTSGFSTRIRVVRRTRVTRVRIKTKRLGRFFVKVTFKRPTGRIAYRKFILRRGITKYITARRGSRMLIRYGRTKRLPRRKSGIVNGKYKTIYL